MRKVERLKSEAREAAHKRGHQLKPFLRDPLKDTSRKVYSTVCLNCEMGVVVNDRPAPNDIDISGEAVALNCKRDVSKLRTSCVLCGNEMEGKRRCPDRKSVV